MSGLETERLRLRELTPADAAFVRELLNEPAFLRFIGDKGVRTLADAQHYIESGPRAMYARFGFGVWLVETKADATPVGSCGLLKRDVLEDVDLGFAFLQRYCGRGYAREAAEAVLAHGRTAFGIGRVIALTARDNEASMKLLGQLGFRFDRVRPACSALAESNVFVRSAEA